MRDHHNVAKDGLLEEDQARLGGIVTCSMKRLELLRSLWTGITPDLRCSFVELGLGSSLTVI